MKQFKLFSLLISLAFLGGSVYGQNGLPKWVFPGTASKVLDLSTGSLSNVTTHSSSSFNYSGASPQRGYANFTDDSGDLLFYVVDNNIYDGDGYFIAKISDFVDNFNATPSSSSKVPTMNLMNQDIRIINVPGECNKYYIVFAADNPHQRYSAFNLGFFYVTLDMNASNIYHPSRNGRLTSLHADPSNIGYESIDQYYARPIDTYNYIDNPNHMAGGFASLFTQPKNGERFMYLTGAAGDIHRYKVDGSGFSFDNFTLNDYIIATNGQSSGAYGLYFNAGNGRMNDADIIKLSNGNYKIAYKTNPSSIWNADFSGWANIRIAVVVATIDGNSGDVIDFEAVSHGGTVLSGNDQRVNGIEFSHDGSYLYMSSYRFPFIHYVNIGAGSNSDNLYTPMPFKGATTNVFDNFKEGHIERGINGDLYFAKASGLGKLDDSNDPSSSWNASAISVNLDQLSYNYGDPGDRGYAIPQSLNNENLNHKAGLWSGSAYASSRVICNGDIAEITFNNPEGLDVTWPDMSTGNYYSHLATSGQNVINFTVTNEFGCSRNRTFSFEAGPVVQLDLTSSNFEYCPKNGLPQLTYQIAFGDPNNSVVETIWDKNGQYYSNNLNSVQADGPGVYCLKVRDYVSGCFSEAVCVEITEGPCSVTDPDYTLTSTTNISDYNVSVVPDETDNCYGHAYYIEDIDNNPGQYYSWNQVQGTIMNGSVPYSFDYGTNYRIIHGIWSSCQSYTSKSYTININTPGARMKVEDEGESNLEVDSKDLNISFYPNPVNSTLKSNLDNSFSQIIILNVDGKEVLRQGSNLSNIDVSELSKGVYFVRVFNQDGTLNTTKKIVKH